MGNKHSSTAGHRTSDPTARSFSWQPEHLNAQPTQLPQPPHRQFMGGTFIDENCNRVPGRNSRDPLRRRSCINGSVVEDEAVFGGVFPAQDQASPLQMSSQFWPPLDGTTSPNESPSKKSKPGTTDSGYFTAFDSDGKSRSSKLRGSRLSLNEAVFNHQDFETSPPLNNMPPMGHFPPPPPGHFEPRHFPMPPPSNGPFIRGPDPFLMPPLFPPADLDSKKAKKWHKKQLKKLQKSNPSDLHLMPLGPMKPNGPQPLIVPPFGNQGLAPFRAQSMGNLAAKGLYLTNQMPEFQIPPPGIPPPPNPLDRRASSHLDLNAAPAWMYLQPPPGQFQVPQKPEIQEIKTDAIGRASKSPHGTGRSLLASAEKASLSSVAGKGSRRSRGGSIAPEPTFFEEERQTTREESSRNSHMLFKRNISPPPSRNSDRDQAIYETLKAKKVLATAEISVVDSPKEQIAEADVTEQRKANFEVNFKEPQLPTKISPEAQAIMERNAKLLGFQQSENFQQSTGKLQAIFTENQETQDVKPPAPAQTQKQSLGIDAALEHLEIVKKSPSAVDEKEIAAIWNPILPRRKHKRPAEFLPLDAWESIDVSAELSARKINKNADKSAAVVSEIIRVHLVPCPPTRSEIQGEPIYFEYDEKLPDFKKRLIETGSFDFPEKFQHSSAESRKEEPSGHKETDHGLHGQNSPHAKDNFQNEDKEKSGSLKRLKNSVSNMFHRSKSAERPQSPSPPENAKIKTGQSPNCQQDILYTSTGSLTPSTANIKAGDSSDIDFSWVHDLETKFRREKEHYDSEFEEVNHKSFRRAQNRSSGDVVPSTTIQPSETGVAKRNFGDFSLQEAVGHSTPAQSRAAASHQRIVVSNDENVDIFGTDCSDHNPVPTRYFGVYETPKDHRVTHLDTESQLRQEELKQFSSNVRTKAAIFEKTNLNNLQISKPQKEIGDRGYFSRNHCPPFIPLPDYDTDYSSTLSVDTKQTNGLLPQVENKNAPAQLSVDTNVNCRSPYRVNAVFRSPRSPSQRKIHRLELQRQQEEGWVSTGIGEIHQGRPAFEPGLRYVHDSRLTAYRPDEMQGVNMVNGDSRLQFRNCGIIQDVFIDDGQVRVQYPMHKQNGYGSDLNLNGYSNGATSMNVYKSQPILNENENRYYVQ